MEHRAYTAGRFRPPMTQELPTFDHDLGLWCKHLLQFKPFPRSLDRLELAVSDIASQWSGVKIPKSFLRTYIFTPGLRIPLILVDSIGDVTNRCVDFAKHRIVYDDIAMLDENDPVAGMFGVPHLVVFQGAAISESHFLSISQALQLVGCFERENLIDWRIQRERLYANLPIG